MEQAASDSKNSLLDCCLVVIGMKNQDFWILFWYCLDSFIFKTD